MDDFVHKYGYNYTEMIIMSLITVTSNISFIPFVTIMYKRRNYFPFFIGLFTLIISIIFHAVEGLGIKKFFNMNELEWHRLENIGTHTSFIFMIIYLMENNNMELDLVLQYSGLILIIFLQESNPWNLWFTFFPIFLYVLLLLLISIKRKRFPKYKNKKMFNKGGLLMVTAIIFFFIGLDDKKDYLRLYHGIWQFFMGIGFFYIWQSQTDISTEFNLGNLFTKRINNKLYDVRFFSDEKI